jgi:hypothetical protein
MNTITRWRGSTDDSFARAHVGFAERREALEMFAVSLTVGAMSGLV